MSAPTVLPTRPLRTLVAGLAIVAAALAGVACGGGAGARSSGGALPGPSSTTSTAPRPTGTVDGLVAIGGGRLHLRCTGEGRSTVVLVAGWGDGGDSWSDMESRLTGHARVCTPSRFGTGTSDPPPRPQTFTTEADDLHELLATAGEPGPYVLVGHSFGGAEAVAFTARHSSEVVGLALIDTSPAIWPQAVCAVPADAGAMAGVFAETCRQLHDAGGNPEHLDGVPAFAEVAAIRSLGDVPAVVLTRAEPVYAGLAPAAAHDLATAWSEGQHAWSALSTRSRLVPVDTQEHYVHLADPDLVAGELLRLLP